MTSIDILITTWPRYIERNMYLARVAESLRDNLKVNQFKTRWVICSESEGVSDSNRLELQRISNQYKFELNIRSQKANLGANLNYAHSLLHGDYILYVQDDFMCTESIDVGIDIDLFKSQPKFKLIRYYWRGATEPRKKISENHFLLSKKCRHYYSDNPHIKVGNFHTLTGKYKTNDNSSCEHDMNDKCKKLDIDFALRRDSNDPEKPRTRFEHIGDKSSMTEKWYNHPSNVAKRKLAAEKAPIKR